MNRPFVFRVSHFGKELYSVTLVLVLTAIPYMPLERFDPEALDTAQVIMGAQPLLFLLIFNKHLIKKPMIVPILTMTMVFGWAGLPFISHVISKGSGSDVLAFYPVGSALLLFLVLTLLFVKIRQWWAYAILVPMLLTVYRMTRAMDAMVLPSREMVLILLGTVAGICFLGKRAYDRRRILAIYRKGFIDSGKEQGWKWRKSQGHLDRVRSEFEKINRTESGREGKLRALERLHQDLREQL